MPASLREILDALDTLAAYDGPWRRLREEGALLGRRIQELRERETRLHDLLVIALVGGSGVGKSTLLNALAGDELAKTSAMRPCTTHPTIYHPPGANIAIEDANQVAGSALEHLVIVDTPDSDTIVREHRARVIKVLQQCDLILLCGSSEKYLDEATWSLLRPLQRERTIVCVETKAMGPDNIRAHWIENLKQHGFTPAGYFRVQARRALDRKLRGGSAGEDELDFLKLEAFLRDELNAERIARIKRSNAAGLLSKTIERLDAQVAEALPLLDDLAKRVREADREVSVETLDYIRDRLFGEPHLWAYAVGREVSLRAKGIVGTLYRVIEAVRTLPTRLAGWIPLLPGRGGAGRQAADLLSSRDLVEHDLQLASERIANVYRTRQSEVAYAFAKAGFDAPSAEAGLAAYQEELNRRVGLVLRGPARDRVVHLARMVTSWPATLLTELPPVLFIFYSGYRIVADFFKEIYTDGFIGHAITVLVLVLAAELFVLSLLTRGLAWHARQSATRDLHTALAAPGLAFQPESTLIATARAEAAKVKALSEQVLG